jgi:hypothetical protein
MFSMAILKLLVSLKTTENTPKDRYPISHVMLSCIVKICLAELFLITKIWYCDFMVFGLYLPKCYQLD